MTYKEQARQNINKHIRGADAKAGRNKGKCAAAWKEVKALELLVKAAKEE